MEIDSGTARQQLQVVEDAMQVSESSAVTNPPAWFYPTLALIGPATIWWVNATIAPADHFGSQELSLLRLGGTIMGVVALASLVRMAVVERRSAVVRPKAPIRGGRTTKWNFLSIFSLVLAFTVGLNIVTINEVFRPYLTGALVYLWIALVPAYCYRRHVMEMRSGT